jgi:peptide/nickel transport system substrate-binding protein
MRRQQLFATVAVAAALSLAAAACSSSKPKAASPGSGTAAASTPAAAGGKLQQVVLGTTDKVISIDPAGAYDEGSWVLQWNIYQSLLKIKAGTADVVPDAASACKWTDTVTYTCTLNPGLVFSNGDPLDAAAVVYSINRVVKINDPNGPSSLLSSMKSVAAQGTDLGVPLHPHDGCRQHRRPEGLPRRQTAPRRPGRHRVGRLHLEQVHGEPAGGLDAEPEVQG